MDLEKRLIKKQQKEALGILWRIFDYNKTEIGKACGASPSVVSNWFARGRISATAAIKIEKHPKVRGIISKEQMRPDVKEWFGV